MPMLATYYDHRSHQILPMKSNPLTQARRDHEQRRSLTDMEISMTPDQLAKRNIDKMGEALGKQYTILFREVSTLHLYWKQYLELFGTNQKRIDRLNQSAPLFFSMLQNELFQTNLLHIARLTDSPKSVGKDNLTLQNLTGLVSDAGLKKTLIDLLAVATDKTQFCRDWRNRLFAHHDLALATGDEEATPLEVATREKVNAALQSLADVMNAVERHYFKGETSFDAIAAHNGAATLLHVLGDGLKQKDRREKLIAEGKFDDLDLPEQI
jgi:AbiU2